MGEAVNAVQLKHPCFHREAKGSHGRVHLAVAPRCNIQCRYCNRREDCVNESRPGVTSRVLTPPQAIEHLLHVLDVEPSISVVGIAGPGDPLANPEATFETLRLVKAYAPQLLLCLSTNGLGLTPRHVATLAGLGVSHVTITINAVDPEIGAQIYERVRDDRVRAGREGAAHLLARQLEGLVALKAKGITVKINTVVIPGINEHHVGEVARRVAALGADFHNCLPLHPAPGTPFAGLPELTPQEMTVIRAQASPFLAQMAHCMRCRADAVGLLGQDRSLEFAPDDLKAGIPTWAGAGRPHVAVATREGILVNQHLGAADRLEIWADDLDGFRLVERRDCPEAGVEGRWDALGRLLGDCRAVLVAAAGETPRGVLETYGVLTLEMEGEIEECLVKVFRGGLAWAHVAKRRNVGKTCGCGQTRSLAAESAC
nr:radical SAM protein [uncultured Holophaga sp.]